MKISVIVPIYNREKFISGAISCLKAQDDPDLEFLLIDDGSTDATSQIMRELCVENDGRFHILSNVENRGYGYTCNLGIRNATGDFVAIYESDDRITSDFYSTLRKVAEVYKEADVIRYNGLYRKEKNRLGTIYQWEQAFTGKVLDKYTLKRFWRSHPSVFNGIYRRSFILQKSVSFCETPGASFQDAMFMVSLFYADPLIYVVNDIKYTYVRHDMQSINFIEDKVDCIIEAWKKENEWLKKQEIVCRDFFLYRVFTQMDNILKKVSYKSGEKLVQAFNELKEEQKYFLYSDIPTFKERIRYKLRFYKLMLYAAQVKGFLCGKSYKHMGTLQNYCNKK